MAGVVQTVPGQCCCDDTVPGGTCDDPMEDLCLTRPASGPYPSYVVNLSFDVALDAWVGKHTQNRLGTITDAVCTAAEVARTDHWAIKRKTGNTFYIHVCEYIVVCESEISGTVMAFGADALTGSDTANPWVASAAGAPLTVNPGTNWTGGSESGGFAGNVWEDECESDVIGGAEASPASLQPVSGVTGYTLAAIPTTTPTDGSGC